VSKRVNIQRLKTDIWGNIRTNMPSVEPENNPLPEHSRDPSTGDVVPKSALSFQDMICELAAGDEVRQKDVTLPFYFICLLHLANEHVSHFCLFCCTVEVIVSLFSLLDNSLVPQR
jgi:condensin complex subunit 2